MADIGASVRLFVANPGLFLNFVATKLEWGELAGDILFDVGCGNPKIKMADLLVERFPDLQRVICIDNQDHLIKYIKCRKPNRLIEHRCADIQKRSDVACFEGLVDKVLSTHTWHMLQDQAGGFSNVFFILRPGGEAAFLFCVSSGYADLFTEMTQNPKWNMYFNGSSPVIPVTQFMSGITDKYYIQLLEEKGFKVVHCEKNKICVPYATDQECKEGLLKLGKCSFAIPSELEDEFQSYVFESFMKHNGRDEEGRPCQISYYLTAIVKKPSE